MIQYNEEYDKSLPKTETIEEYYTRNGLVYNEDHICDPREYDDLD